MRILNIVSGIAVLFTTLAFAHLVQHHFFYAATDDDAHNPVFLARMIPSMVVGVLSLIGGCLLLGVGGSDKRARPSSDNRLLTVA